MSKENNKLIDAIIDLGAGMKELGQEMKGMRKEQQETNKRLEKLEKQQEKTNLHLAEHSRSIIALAEQQEETNAKLDGLRSEFSELRADFNKYADSNNARVNGHEKRIVQLEDAISDNGGKRMFMAKEPEAKYRKKKKND